VTVNLGTRRSAGPDKDGNCTENGISAGSRSSCHLPHLVPAAATRHHGWL